MVDDELLLLAYQEQLIRGIDGFELIGMYSDPTEAFQAILKDEPDVVFLDIEMFDVNGIEMADRILAVLPMTKIIFVTAYSDYAVQAFEVNALDYLLKPLNKERLLKTYERLHISNNKEIEEKKEANIYTLPNLLFNDENGEEVSVKWRTSKAKELFVLLLQYREKQISKDIILENLWPEYEMEKGYTYMYTAIYQIRNAIKSIGFTIQIKSEHEYYILHLSDVSVDVDQWEQGLKNFSRVTDKNVNEIETLMGLYKGDYLADLTYTWLEIERERLRLIWIKWMNELGEYYKQKGQAKRAVQLYETMQKICPYSEENYFELMKLFNELGDRQNVESQYKRLQAMMQEQFAVEPMDEVRQWYGRWKSEL